MQDTLPNTLRKTQPAQRVEPAMDTGHHRQTIRRLAWIGTLLAVVGVWHLVATLGVVESFLLPSPQAVASKFYAVLLDGRLWVHTRTTLMAVLAGLGIGVLIGVSLGYVIAKNPLLEDLLSPVVVAFQSTPIVAYAPLLVIWFGSGVESKVITCVVVVFFPMLMNTVVGLRNVPGDLRDLMRASRASRWQMFIKLELPSSMPVLLTGLKTSATLAVIGAVVGEFIVANAGLGFLVKLAKSQFDTPLVFVAVITLGVMAGVLYGTVSLLERRLLAWQRHNA